MRKYAPYIDIAMSISRRPTLRYSVRVAAVIFHKSHGLISVGWNHEINIGNAADGGLGKHAEEHAIDRAHVDLDGAYILTIARRRKGGNIICSRPCEKARGNAMYQPLSCMERIRRTGIRKVLYSVHGGTFEVLDL